jgi:hypothetical protein
MTELDERKLDPAVALSSLDETAPREPHRLFALKQGDCFAVADALRPSHRFFRYSAVGHDALACEWSPSNRT